MFENILLIAIRFVTWLLSILPYTVALSLVTGLLKIGYFFNPKLWRITLRNLELAYPESDPAWKSKIARESIRSLARVFVDFARLSRLSPQWVQSRVQCDLLERYRAVKQAAPARGVLLVTGHLGSFELLGHCMPMFGHPIAFVVRNFKMKKIDAWWTAQRQAYGNRVIGRKGAFQDVVRSLREGLDVAILFDQNVTRNHAVFVDFFGIQAATSKTPALTALRTECPIFIASIAALGNDRYEIVAVELEASDVYANASLTPEEKVKELTQRMSTAYEKMIRDRPGEWFWMHRRFKTRPNEGEESIYAGC